MVQSARNSGGCRSRGPVAGRFADWGPDFGTAMGRRVGIVSRGRIRNTVRCLAGRRSLSKDFRRCRVRHALWNYQAAKDLNREERKENAKPAKRPHSLTRYPNSIFILFSAVLQLTTLLR